MNIVIPMAGDGRRFKEAGYELPKPLIDVKGKPMINRVIANLDPKHEHKIILITRKEHKIKEYFQGIDITVVELDTPTEGALCTALRAGALINNSNALLIANCDQLLNIDMNEYINRAEWASLVTFNSTNPHHSYVRTNRRGFVLEAKEKEVISDQAVAGLYYFKRGYDFVNFGENTIHANIRYNGEFYITPMMNLMIAKGLIINTYEIDVHDKHMLGTPQELQIFLDKVDKGVVDLSEL